LFVCVFVWLFVYSFILLYHYHVFGEIKIYIKTAVSSYNAALIIAFSGFVMLLLKYYHIVTTAAVCIVK